MKIYSDMKRSNTVDKLTAIIDNYPSSSANINVGPEINCDNVDTVNNKNNFICFKCNKNNSHNSVLLTMSNTISFVFGAFLDSMCCCLTSMSQKALLTAVLTVIVVGAATGGILGK